MQSESLKGELHRLWRLEFSLSVIGGFFNFWEFFKKDTTSVFHKDINVYSPAQQKE